MSSITILVVALDLVEVAPEVGSRHTSDLSQAHLQGIIYSVLEDKVPTCYLYRVGFVVCLYRCTCKCMWRPGDTLKCCSSGATYLFLRGDLSHLAVATW